MDKAATKEKVLWDDNKIILLLSFNFFGQNSKNTLCIKFKKILIFLYFVFALVINFIVYILINKRNLKKLVVVSI